MSIRNNNLNFLYKTMGLEVAVEFKDKTFRFILESFNKTFTDIQ